MEQILYNIILNEYLSGYALLYGIKGVEFSFFDYIYEYGTSDALLNWLPNFFDNSFLCIEWWRIRNFIEHILNFRHPYYVRQWFWGHYYQFILDKTYHYYDWLFVSFPIQYTIEWTTNYFTDHLYYHYNIKPNMLKFFSEDLDLNKIEDLKEAVTRISICKVYFTIGDMFLSPIYNFIELFTGVPTFEKNNTSVIQPNSFSKSVYSRFSNAPLLCYPKYFYFELVKTRISSWFNFPPVFIEKPSLFSTYNILSNFLKDGADLKNKSVPLQLNSLRVYFDKHNNGMDLFSSKNSYFFFKGYSHDWIFDFYPQIEEFNIGLNFDGVYWDYWYEYDTDFLIYLNSIPEQYRLFYNSEWLNMVIYYFENFNNRIYRLPGVHHLNIFREKNFLFGNYLKDVLIKDVNFFSISGKYSNIGDRTRGFFDDYGIFNFIINFYKDFFFNSIMGLKIHFFYSIKPYTIVSLDFLRYKNYISSFSYFYDNGLYFLILNNIFFDLFTYKPDLNFSRIIDSFFINDFNFDYLLIKKKNQFYVSNFNHYIIHYLDPFIEYNYNKDIFYNHLNDYIFLEKKFLRDDLMEYSLKCIHRSYLLNNPSFEDLDNFYSKDGYSHKRFVYEISPKIQKVLY